MIQIKIQVLNLKMLKTQIPMEYLTIFLNRKPFYDFELLFLKLLFVGHPLELQWTSDESPLEFAKPL
jgi:hypothetical protein